MGDDSLAVVIEGRREGLARRGQLSTIRGKLSAMIGAVMTRNPRWSLDSIRRAGRRLLAAVFSRTTQAARACYRLVRIFERDIVVVGVYFTGLGVAIALVSIMVELEALASKSLTERLSIRFGASLVVPLHVHPTVLLAWGL